MSDPVELHPKHWMIHSRLVLADRLHRAALYLAAQFSLEMSPVHAKSNLEARALLVRAQNAAVDSAEELYVAQL